MSALFPTAPFAYLPLSLSPTLPCTASSPAFVSLFVYLRPSSTCHVIAIMSRSQFLPVQSKRASMAVIACLGDKVVFEMESDTANRTWFRSGGAIANERTKIRERGQ
jgi:hypothetical protein